MPVVIREPNGTIRSSGDVDDVSPVARGDIRHGKGRELARWRQTADSSSVRDPEVPVESDWEIIRQTVLRRKLRDRAVRGDPADLRRARLTEPDGSVRT